VTITREARAFDVADPALAAEGVRRIEWAEREMPVLRLIRERFEKEQPLKAMRIGACLHVTSETANLMRTIVAGGATVTLCASNPLSTQDDVAAALSTEYGVPTFARRGIGREGYYDHLNAVADRGPQVTMDDGCDLVTLLHTERREQLAGVIAGTEETTTGVIRLRAMAADGALEYPVVAVNEAQTKHLFDNRYGTGQSTVDGILRATNILIAGRRAVVAGYGWVGRGIASRLRGMGAMVAIVEVDHVRALEALMDGYLVKTAEEAAPWGELFVTATGNLNVFRGEHFEQMADGAIMANSGHFNDELELGALVQMSNGRCRTVRTNVQEYDLGSKKLYVLAEGRLVNLAAAEGHPAAVMDMSFANQALSLEYLAKHHTELAKQVYVVPGEIDQEVARLKLAALGVELDPLTEEQAAYAKSWQSGT
jgi:adenosylhomocysteinase